MGVTMPGISIKCEFEKSINTSAKVEIKPFLEALDLACHTNDYSSEILLQEGPYVVGSSKYREYPIKVFENTDFWICFEGKIYNKDDLTLSNEINKLVSHIFNSTANTKEDDRKNIAAWLLNSDGDFLIYALHKKTNDLIIINDVLGRLPLYYYKDNYEFVVSRNLQVVSTLTRHNIGKTSEFDMMGIAQFLLFCHTIGKRTLLSNIYKLEPGSLLTIKCNKREMSIDNLHKFNFEEKKYANNSVKKNAEELASLFCEACRTRVDQSSKNIISLSGGFDSRCIAACFHKNKTDGLAVTSTEPNWKSVVGDESEEDVAEKIANTTNIQWEDYGISTPQDDDLVQMLRMKNGMTYLAHSFLLRFLDKIKQKYKPFAINFFTGHGGDFLFSDLSFELSGVDEVVYGVIYVKGYLGLSEVSDITNIKKKDIIAELRNVISSYPEKKPSQKLVHYLFFESNAKFSFEIEDLNRNYFWSVAPFYSIPFFNYIMNCPDEKKSQSNLYREFLISLSPSVASIKNSNWGCTILSMRFRVLQRINVILWKYPKLRNVARKLKDKRRFSYQCDSKIIRQINQQVTDCNGISNYLSSKAIGNILKNSSNYHHMALDNLFTITSLMEMNLCENSTLLKN
jgi:asparagine synthase (glutamine-hydrolysing)